MRDRTVSPDVEDQVVALFPVGEVFAGVVDDVVRAYGPGQIRFAVLPSPVTSAPNAGASCTAKVPTPPDEPMGAASIVQQCIRAGVLDEIHIDLVPVLLGGGVSLFDHLGTGPIDLERTRVIEGWGDTSTFRVVK